MGEDKFGNKYYENNEYMFGQNRWVIYNIHKTNVDYDASMIDPAWHGWMHYMTDVPPTKANYPQHRWMVDHVANKTGTPQQYVPYSTTPPKITGWQPGTSQGKIN
jgi:NADH dehydrogenase (ubiquinone) 1 alpha subcomplex subunit 12